MKKIIFSFLISIFLIGSLNAQEMPKKIKSFLDAYYNSEEFGNWKGVPNTCGDTKWLLTADFNGDGQTDYLARFTTGATEKTKRLHLIAFFNQNGEFTPEPFFEEAYDERLKRSSSSIIKKGNTVSLGFGEEGEGPTTTLKTDGVFQFVCETDDYAIFFYQNGEMKPIREAASQKPKISAPVSRDHSPQIMASSDKSKQMPRAVEDYLNRNHQGWEISPESELCGEKLLFVPGDFNGDRKTDYLVHFLVNKNTPKGRLLLYAFLNKGNYYEPHKIAEDDNREDFGMLSFSIIKKGTEVSLGVGEEGETIHKIKLKTDAVTLFKCETDASSTFIYKNKRFKDLRD